MILKQINIVLLGNRVRRALAGRVLISKRGYWMSRHQRPKGGRRDEPKEKQAFAGLAAVIPLYFLYRKTHCSDRQFFVR